MRGPTADQFKGFRVQGHITGRQGLLAGLYHGGVDAKQTSQMVFAGSTIGAGGNSGFQLLNLVVNMGARRVVLLGYDFNTDGGTHWHGDHVRGLQNPNASFLKRCAHVLDQQADALARRGVEVINATRQTSLRNYERQTIEKALGI